MDNITKIDKLRNSRGWTLYKLSQEANLSPQTVHQWMARTSEPSLEGIKHVCDAFGITLSNFFAENDLVELTPEMKELYGKWICLNKNERESILSIINNYISKK